MSDSKIYMFPESEFGNGANTALLASTLSNQNCGMNSAWRCVVAGEAGQIYPDDLHEGQRHGPPD